jgi:hypothetical protein
MHNSEPMSLYCLTASMVGPVNYFLRTHHPMIPLATNLTYHAYYIMILIVTGNY